MRVIGYTWVGFRTADLESSVRFFSGLLRLPVLHREEAYAQFELASGQLFEVLGSESRYYQYHACPVLAFQVEDVRTAREELLAKGVEFVTDVDGDEAEAGTYFRGPDGYLYQLWQTKRTLGTVLPDRRLRPSRGASADGPRGMRARRRALDVL